MFRNNTNDLQRNTHKRDPHKDYRLSQVGTLFYDSNEFTKAITGCDDVKNVENFFKSPLDKDKFHLQTFSGLTPIFLATYHGHTEIVKFLIGKGCDFNTASHTEATPWIQNQGAQGDVHSYSSSKNKNTHQFFRHATPLMVAIMQDRAAIIDLLLKQDELIIRNLADGGQSVLHLAIYKGNVSVVQKLLSRTDIELDIKDNKGISVVNYAIDVNNKAILELILAKINEKKGERTKSGKTMWDELINIQVAVPSKEQIEAYCKIPIDSDENFSVVPLMRAIQQHRYDIVQALLSFDNVNPNIRDENFYMTPLMMACSTSKIEIIDLLLKKHADVALADLDGNNALYYVLTSFAPKIYPNILQVMLDQDKDIRLCASDQFKALLQSMLIAYYQFQADYDSKKVLTDIIRRILIYNSVLAIKHSDECKSGHIALKISSRDNNSNIKLIFSSSEDAPVSPKFSFDDKKDIDKWLIEIIKGYRTPFSDVLNKIHVNKSLLDIILKDYGIQTRFMLELKAINHIKPGGRTLLSYFLEYGYQDLITQLLSYGIDTKEVGIEKHQLLFDAVQHGNYQIVRQLLDQGADIHGVSKGKSILYYALSNIDEEHLEGTDEKTIGYHTTLELLLQYQGPDASLKLKKKSLAPPLVNPSVTSLPIEAYLKLFKFVWHSIKKSPNTAKDLLPVMAIHERLIAENEKKNIKKILQVIKSARADCEFLAKISHVEAILTDNLSKSCQVENSLYQGQNPLLVAVRRGYRDVVEKLLDLNFPIYGNKAHPINPLFVAIEKGDQDIFELLLAKATPADIKRDHGGKSSIFCAIQHGNRAIVEKLVNVGADLTQVVGEKRLTPLLYALSLKHASIDLILYLIEVSNQADLLAQDRAKHGVLWYAVSNNHLVEARLIIEKILTFDMDLPEAYEMLCLDQVKQDPELYSSLQKYVLDSLDNQIGSGDFTTVTYQHRNKNKVNESTFTLTGHASQRMQERLILKEHIVTLLKSSNFENQITQKSTIYPIEGKVSVKVSGQVSEKVLCIITAKVNDQLIIITTYWKNSGAKPKGACAKK